MFEKLLFSENQFLKVVLHMSLIEMKDQNSFESSLSKNHEVITKLKIYPKTAHLPKNDTSGPSQAGGPGGGLCPPPSFWQIS